MSRAKTLSHLYKYSIVTVFATVFLLISVPSRSGSARDSLKREMVKRENVCNVVLFQQLANTYIGENADSSVSILMRGAVKARKCKSYFDEANCFRSIGALNFLRSQYDDAIIYYNKAITVYEKYHKCKELSEAYRGLGLCYFDEGEYTQSIIQYNKALQVAETYQDTILKGKILNSIGSSLEMMEDYQNAMLYYKMAVDIRLQLRDSSGMAVSYMNLGNMYVRNKKKKDALESLQLAYEIAGKLNDHYILTNALICLATAYSEFNMLAESEKYWKMALEKTEHSDYEMQNAEVANGLSEVYIKTNRFREALALLDKNIVLVNRIKARNELKTSVYLKAEALAGLKRFEEAYKVIKEYADQKLEMLSGEDMGVVKDLQGKYEKEMDARLIAELKYKNQQRKFEAEREKENSRTYFMVLSVISVLMLIMGILAFYNFRNSRINKKSLQEKEILLKEVHHRVKNNFQLISSLINLQGSMIEDEAAIAALNKSKNRILSMALVHEFIYQADSLDRIQMKDYMHKLSSMIVNSFNENRHDIEIKIDCGNIEFGVETVIPFGLILNELITNSVKYAFPERDGRIEMKLEPLQSGKYRFFYADNGVGLPPDFHLDKLNSLGMELAQLLAAQLKGAFKIVDSDKGAAFELVFIPE